MNTKLINRFNSPVEFPTSDETVADLKARYAGLSIKDGDKKSYEIVRSAIADIRRVRVGVENRRKELKQDALEFGRKVDAEAKRITAQLVEIEQSLINQKNAVDEAKARAKREAEETVERARLAEIERLRLEEKARVEAEQQAERERLAAERAEIEKARQEIEAQRQAEAAQRAKEEADLRKKREAEEAAITAQRERERQAQREAQAKIDAENEATRQRLLAEQRAIAERRVELDRIENEKREAQRAKEEAERKAKAEREEAERLERLAPAKHKALAIAKMLESIEWPETNEPDAVCVFAEAMDHINDAIICLKTFKV